MNQKEFEFLVELYRDLESLGSNLEKVVLEQVAPKYLKQDLEVITKRLRRTIIKGLKRK